MLNLIQHLVNNILAIANMLFSVEETDPAYFHKLLTTYSLQTADVVYFEHSPEAVKSAESVGIKTFFYDANKKDLVGLRAFLDENLA